MKHGSDWYKREPNAYLGGVQGFTAKEHAVFSVVLELIYSHGGSVNNDPSWFSGWIKDMGPASVRKAIDSLVAAGKLEVDGDQITQKRAKTEAKTKENLRETREKSGKKGGIASGKSRSTSNENNTLDEASASPREEKRREEKKGDTNVSLLRSDFSKHFQDFWDAFPHRGNKKTKRPDAETAFKKAIKGGATVEQIARGVEDMRRDPDVARGYGRGPVPWLNQKGWTDEIPQDQPQLKAINGGQHGQRNDNSQNANMAGNAALEQIARLAKLR